jgi:hypothetical protein
MTLIRPHWLTCMPVQRQDAAVRGGEIDMLLHHRWRGEERLRGAIRPGDLVRKGRGVRGEAAIVRRAAFLRPGMRLKVNAEAGGGARWIKTQIKEDAHRPGGHATQESKHHEKPCQAAEHNSAPPLTRELLRFGRRSKRESGV